MSVELGTGNRPPLNPAPMLHGAGHSGRSQEEESWQLVTSPADHLTGTVAALEAQCVW